MINRKVTNRSRAGFSLAEVAVATAVFSMVVLAAFQLYDQSQKLYVLGEAATDQQQSTRIGFEQMMSDLRLTGFDVNRDSQNIVIDEKIEGVWNRAIAVRANFNYNQPDIANVRVDRGREVSLELPVSTTNPTPRAVTTGNGEIIVYALKSADSTQNSDSLTVNVDIGTPRRGVLSAVTLSGVELSGTHPPYNLIKTQIGAGGAFDPPVILASNIRDLVFTYTTNMSDQPLTTANVTALNNKLDTTNVTMTIVGTSYTLPANQFRSSVRTIKVALTGASAIPDWKYVDKAETLPASDPSKMLYKRKFILSADATPRGMTVDGEIDIDVNPPSPPSNLQLFGGHCQALLATWTPSNSSDIAGYEVCWGAIASPTETNATCFPVDAATQPVYVNVGAYGTFYVSVRAFDGSTNYSSYANASGFNVSAATNTTVPLPVATAVTATANNWNGTTGDGSVTLSWTPPAYNTAATTVPQDVDGTGKTPLRDLKGYRIYRRRWSWCSSATPPTSPDYSDFTVDVSTNPAGLPDAGTELIADETSVSSPPFTDYTVGTCVTAFYKVVPVDRCGKIAASASPAMGSTGGITAYQDPSKKPVRPGFPPQAAPILLTTTSNPVSAVTQIWAPGTKVQTELFWLPVTQDSGGGQQSYSRYRVEVVPTIGGVDQPPNYISLCAGQIPTFPAGGTVAFAPSTTCGTTTSCFRYTFAFTSASTSTWQSVHFRIQAQGPCTSSTDSTPLSDDVTGWSIPRLDFPVGCAASSAVKTYSVTGSAGGSHSLLSPSSAASPLVGDVMGLYVDASKYTTLGFPVTGVTISTQPSNGQSNGSITLTPLGTNPASCAPAAAICGYYFTGPMLGKDTSQPYNLTYRVDAGSGCFDLVNVTAVYISQANSCGIATQSTNPYLSGTPGAVNGIPQPRATKSAGNNYDQLTTFVARNTATNATGSNTPIRIDKIAMRFEDNSTLTVPGLTTVNYTDKTAGTTVTASIYVNATGLTIPTGAQTVVFTLGTPIFLESPDDLYGIDLKFGANMANNSGATMTTHPGLGISFRTQAFNSAKTIPTGPYIWCAGDPTGGIQTDGLYNFTGPFDDFWTACASGCSNTYPR